MTTQVQERFQEVYRCSGKRQTFLGVDCKPGDIVPNATSLPTFRILLGQGLISGPHMAKVEEPQEQAIGEETVNGESAAPPAKSRSRKKKG